MANRAQPFDAVAARYDAEFTDRLLGSWLRRRVWGELNELVHPGETWLELGCGTGEDAVWLADQGLKVLATDASTAMVEATQRKAAARGASRRVTAAQLDLLQLSRDGKLPSTSPAPPFDAALSNFGALNCLDTWRPLGRALAAWIRPGGVLALVVMGPVCPWEIFYYLARARPATALRRLRSSTLARVGTQELRVAYPTPGRLARELGPDFAPVRAAGIGVLLPPSYLAGAVERWPAFFRRLDRLEGRILSRWWASRLCDHYLLVLKRR